MPSLGDLLSRHASVLWIDAASSSVQAGILAADEPARWAQVEGDYFSRVTDVLTTIRSVPCHPHVTHPVPNPCSRRRPARSNPLSPSPSVRFSPNLMPPCRGHQVNN